MLLENKTAVIYGWGKSISGAVAWTFANLTSGTFPSYIPPLQWQLSVKEKQLLPIPKLSDAVCHHCRLS